MFVSFFCCAKMSIDLLREQVEEMITGKLNWDVLKKLLARNQGAIRPEVEKGGAVGEDCAVVNLGKEKLVLSTDPVTAAAEDAGHIAFHININDIATTGAKPLGIMVTILAPKEASLVDIEKVMRDISKEAKDNDVMILGGHTEVTDAVNRMIVSVTALGTMDHGEQVVWTGGAKVHDKLIVTKALGLEGTSILVSDFWERSREVLTDEEMEAARNFAKELSVLKEGRLMRKLASSMHDITEGGILGALWEVKEASGKGFKVDYEKLPVREVTKKLCDAFSLDPLKLISSGSMLMTVENAEEALSVLKKHNIEAHIIGEVLEEGSILVKGGEETYVEAPQRDEIYKLYD